MKMTNLKSLRPILGVIGISFSAMALAGGIEMPPDNGIYFSLFGGPNWLASGTTASVNLGDLETNLYVGNPNRSAVGPMVGGDIGYHWQSMRHRLWLNAGLESSYTQTTSFHGVVQPLFFLDPTFDTLSYNYEVSAVPLFGELTLGGRMGLFEPYVIGGVGLSWNEAYNYNEVPTNPDASASPMRAMYTTRTQSCFAWNVGGGIGIQAASSTMVSIEYRYTDYGNVGLNPTPLQTTNQTLNLGELTANALLARVTVVFHSS